MKRISVTRLACLTAARIYKYYREPSAERKFYGLRKTVVEAGPTTDRLLSMSNMAIHKDRRYYITFDEVIIRDDVAYLYTRKVARNGSKPSHLTKCQTQVGLLAAFFELSSMRMCTVKRLVEHGYKSNNIDLRPYKLVYVLDYNGQEYDIMPNSIACLGWAHAKMQAVDSEAGASIFDQLPLPEVVALGMAK